MSFVPFVVKLLKAKLKIVHIITRLILGGAQENTLITCKLLAERGHEVDLFERRAEAVSQASFANEGKIHLGFIYAKDGGLRTADRMIEGEFL